MLLFPRVPQKLPRMPPSTRLRLVTTWTLQALVAVMFVLVGFGKFADPHWKHNFALWGYPSGFYLVVGAIEIVAGLALLIPRLTVYAALTLIVIMVGAAFTRIWWHD